MKRRKKRNPVSLAMRLRAQKAGRHPNKKRERNKKACRRRTL